MIDEDALNRIRNPEFDKWVEPITENPDATNEKMRTRAITSNPVGVTIWSSLKRPPQVAGYLGFENTLVFKSWFVQLLSEYGVLHGFEEYYENLKTINPKVAIDVKVIFTIIDQLKDRDLHRLVSAGYHKSIQLKEISKKFASKANIQHYITHLRAMHAMIDDNPVHFPGDILPEDERYRLHTAENWYRALRVLIFFKENLSFFSAVGHVTKPAVKPLFFDVSMLDNAQAAVSH